MRSPSISTPPPINEPTTKTQSGRCTPGIVDGTLCQCCDIWWKSFFVRHSLWTSWGIIGGLISGEDTPSFRFSAIINQWRSFVLPGLLIGFLVGLLVCQSIPYAFLMMLLAATCFIKTVEVEATALLTAMSLTILWVRNGHNSRRHFTYCNLLLS